MADTLKPLICPACNKTMDKVFIPTEGINVDICTNCGGIYFDNRELEHFDENKEDVSKIMEKLEGREFEKVPADIERHCPNCGNKMVKNFSSIDKSIEIDECYNCGGKFLDNSELTKIRAEYETEAERSEDVLQYMYSQIGADLAKADEAYCETKLNRSLYRSILYKFLKM